MNKSESNVILWGSVEWLRIVGETMDERDVTTLIHQAAADGVTLWVEEGRLHFKAPEGKLTKVVRDALQSRRHELIGRLSVPIYRKKAQPPAVTRFPACSRGLWQESEASVSFRHSTHFAVKLTGKIAPEQFESAFLRLSSRHDLLRSRVAVGGDGVPLLHLDDDPAPVVKVIDVSNSTGAGLPLAVKAAVEQAIYAPFEDGRIFRGRVVKVSDVEHVVAVVLHHFVADAVSLEILAGELLGGLLRGSGSLLPTGARPLQYADYLLGMNEWLAGWGLEYRLGLWRQKMRNAPALRFPLVEECQSADGGTLDVLTMHVGATQRAKLAHAIALAGVPVPSAILALNFAALARTFRRSDFFTMYVHSGRTEPVLLDLVGFTVNSIPVRVTVARQVTYMDLMVHVHDEFSFARDHQVPWGILMPMLSEVGASYVAPLFNYRFVARDTSSSRAMSPQIGRIAIESVPVECAEQTNSVDWKSYELHVMDNGVEMDLVLKYMPSVYQRAAVEDFARTLWRCLEELADDPTCAVCGEFALMA